MNLTLIFDADPVIQIHLFSAVAALIIGAVILWRRKGTKTHKMFGKAWGALMVIVALSSFFISEIKLWGPFSPIHLLSVVTLYSLYRAIKAIREGNIEVHRRTLQGLYLGGLVVAGLFTLMPGRLLYRVLFENAGLESMGVGSSIAIAFAGAIIAGALVYGIGKFMSNGKSGHEA